MCHPTTMPSLHISRCVCVCVFVHVQSIFVVLLNNLAFLSTLQSELAAKRIGKVLNVNQQNEQLMEEYEQMASTVSAPV